MKNLRILLDMDGVLVNFVSGVAQRWGLTDEEVYAVWQPGVWEMMEPLSIALRRKYGWVRLVEGRPAFEDPEDITLDEFWAQINGSEDFWLNLDPLPWAKDLLDLVQSLTDDWHIISAPSRCNSSYSGKVRWLKNYFGDGFDRFALTPHKHIFAQPGVVLIDDREANCERFVADEEGDPTGGSAVVFPARCNALRGRAGDPVGYLREHLGCLAETRHDDWEDVWRSLRPNYVVED